MKNRLTIVARALLIVGGAMTWGGAILALHETGNINFSGVIIAAGGFILLVYAVLLLDSQNRD